MKKLFGGAAALALVSIIAIAARGDGAPERVGYFKSESRNRVMAFVAPEGMTGAQAEQFLAGRMHTVGHLTFAVIYRPGARHPGDRLTSAPDYFAAAEMLDSPPFDGWTWGAVINIAGQVQFQEK